APADPAIHYATTMPGPHGASFALVAEAIISMVLMLVVLFDSNHKVLSRYTPYCVGALYALFITLEAPLSGMSMNPARTFGPAFAARYWHALWLYFLAPTLGNARRSRTFPLGARRSRTILRQAPPRE